ncbi:MAG: two-partner secretion domain-containing protein [Nitrospiria bacterium]
MVVILERGILFFFSMALFTFGISGSGFVHGNPLGPLSTQGVGNIQGLGSREVTIQQTAPKAIINWQQFNIAPNETTRFIQPSSQSIILNRIFDSNPSQVFGSLFANGSVILLNPNGVMFGKNAQVNVNGLIASSLNLTDSGFLSGHYIFEGSALSGPVKNAGTLQTGTGGFVYLFAPNVENSGIIVSPQGHISLSAGTSAYLSDRPDGLGFLVQVTAPAGEAVNLGSLVADGGRINLYGLAVNQEGLIQADSIREKSGQIELFAAQTLNLKNGSRILARGGGTGVSPGGIVTVISDKKDGVTTFEKGALIDISGGNEGGNGGFSEVSGHQVIDNGAVKGVARSGFPGGRFLLDPYDLTVDQSYFDSLLGYGLSNIMVQADHDINVGPGAGLFEDLTAWASLSNSSALTFQAKHDIHFSNTLILDNLVEGSSSRWSFTASAGNDIVLTGTQITVGNGGGINLAAGRDIRLEQGVPGTSLGSYSYLWTNGGGDIHLTAGRDLIAPVVFDSTFNQYSGIRLDKGTTNQVGNLFIAAGGDFKGGMVDGTMAPPGFTLSNGVAEIRVNGSFGAADNYAKLILGKGDIKITALKDIYLGNVEDKGLVEVDKAIVDPNNQVDLTSMTGDIHLKPTIDQVFNHNVGRLAAVYPASFSAIALRGSIFFESDSVGFWPSYTGSLIFGAWSNIEGKTPSGSISAIAPFYPDPKQIIGQSSIKIDQANYDNPQPLSLIPPSQNGNAENDPPHYRPAPIFFKTVNGDITHLSFDFSDPVIQKEVTIASGNDLTDFNAYIEVPTKDSKAVLIASRDMIFANADPLKRPSGVSFTGEGEGIIRAGRNLDLAGSDGIGDKVSNNVYRTNEVGQSGLMDISVGGALLMTKSKIWTYNGAGIDIHGLNGSDSPAGFILRDQKDENGNPIQEKVSVDVGSNVGGNDLGIVTLRGGDIHILAAENVDVNASRVATINGGDIHITSTGGNINAGVGSPDAQVDFTFRVSDGHGNLIDTHIQVPGSGIFTFDKDDPKPLPHYPPLQPGQMSSRLLNLYLELIKQNVLGHDAPDLNARFLQEYGTEGKIQNAIFRKDWKLGDIFLTAGQDVVVPPAGVRGKVVTIKAANLVVLPGGQISGDTNLNVGSIKNAGAITGPLSGNVGNGSVPVAPSAPSSGLGSLSGATGSILSTSASAATVTASEVSNSADKAAEAEPDREEAGKEKNDSTQSADNSKRKKHGAGMKSLRIKHGVIIDVEPAEIPGTPK